MTLGEQLAIVVSETGLLTDQCRACERQGLPILPLRQALVPDYSGDPFLAENGQFPTRLGWRTLRAGYLYVLLDRSIWHAYQVTPDGYLRQFNPYTPPAANESLLASTCVSADHDAPASFLNIDTHEHRVAWLAFASDPWPTRVLDAYKAGRAPHRFQALDLAQARDNPASLGLAMTAESLQVDERVLEYQSLQAGQFPSVHGVYPRALRRQALKGFLRNITARHELQQGVLAFVLDDTVGLVQEYNAQRTAWIHARQQWLEDPLRAYQHQTSQILLAIRAQHRDRAEAQTPSFEPTSGDGPPVFVDPGVERQRIIDHQAVESDQNLEQRYDEAARARFQQGYDKRLQRYQQFIDQSAEAYAAACRTARFNCIEQHDYDGAVGASGRAYATTMALCLRGGISEAPAPNGDERGPSAQLWRAWLSNPQSPIYRALLLRDQSLLANLLPTFEDDASIVWNDSERLYSALSKLIASDRGEYLLGAYLKQSMADLLGALNAASARLQPIIGPAVGRVVSRVNSASQLLHNRLHLTELQVQMKLSEYYALQSEHLRNLQHNAVASMDRSWDSILEEKGTRDLNTRKVTGKVRPLIQGGLLSLALLDPKLASLTITVSVWVEGKASNLLQETQRGMAQLTDSTHSALQDVRVGMGTLDPKARQVLQGLKVSSKQAAQWVRTGFTGLRGAVGGDMLLALGGMYLLNDALNKNLKEAERVVGDKSLEARLALYGSSLGVLGGGLELVGGALARGGSRVLMSGGLSVRGAAAIKKTADAGGVLARAGAVIGAATGIFEAMQAWIATHRTLSAGDNSAAGLYAVSMVPLGFGAGFGVVAAASGKTALLGPMGLGVILGLAGYAVYKLAQSKESTPFEQWAKRCYFGNANETPKVHWIRPDQAHIAIAELNAITLGLGAGIHFRLRMTGLSSPDDGGLIPGLSAPVYEQCLEYRVSLPYFDATRSAYRWAVTIHRRGDETGNQSLGGEVIVEGEWNPPPVLTSASERRAALKASTRPRQPDYKENSITPRVNLRTVRSTDGSPMPVKDIQGAIVLLLESRHYNIEGATLSLTYWPDRDVQDAYAELSTMDFL